MTDSHDLERTRPMDCTSDGAEGDTPDVNLNVQSVAMELFGKPYGELNRCDQTLSDSIAKGRRKEIEARINSLKTNNLLAVNERIARAAPLMDQLWTLTQQIVKSAAELASEDDMTASLIPAEQGGYVKTREGTLRRRIRNMKGLTQIVKSQAEIDIAYAKLEERKQAQGTTFIKQDSRQIVVPLQPEDVKERLARFGKGETVEQVSFETDSEDGGDDSD